LPFSDRIREARSIQTVDADRWRLTVIDGDGHFQLTLADLSAYNSQLRALLDCTSGWYAEQDWTGAPVSAPPPRFR
jgi:hypothetical protein